MKIYFIILFCLFVFLNSCSKHFKTDEPLFGESGPTPIIKRDVIKYGTVDFNVPKGVDFKYYIKFDIDSAGIPNNIVLDKHQNSLYDSLAIEYIKAMRFKSIDEYPVQFRKRIQKKAVHTVKFRNIED